MTQFHFPFDWVLNSFCAQGLGYGMLLVRFYVNVYYVIVCAWAFFYLFVGFTSKLPWSGEL